MKIELSQTFQVLADTGPTGPSRTIQGVAVPYNVDANASTGPVRFLSGSLPTDGPAPKLLMHHDSTLPVGLVTERVDTETAMLFSARISDTVAGNEALTLALDGVIDGVSVGIIAREFTFDDGVLVVSAADWRELSMTPFPAFSAAAITDVAAELADDSVDVPTDDDTTSSDTSEEDQMADVEAQAPIQSAPIFLGGALTKPRITASEYIHGILTGNRSVMAADNELSDIPGLLPEPLQGDVWNTQFAQRPIIDAVGTRALPQAGELFYRRRISQHTAVGVQVAQFDPLSSQPYQVVRQQFDKVTIGGYLNVSAQSGDWSEPALIQQILNDMVRQYAIASEAYVAGRLNNWVVPATDLIADYTDGDDVISALYNGAGELRSATGVLPTHLIVSTSVWAKLGQAVTATGQYIFPYLSPSNTAGQMGGAAVLTGNPLGLSLIISDDIDCGSGPGDNAMLLYGPALEVYENRNGAVRVENPATASATLGLWGYVAADLIGQNAPAYCLALNS